MSADRWEVCPQCIDRLNAEYTAQVKLHHANYGIISQEEWIAEGSAVYDTAPDPESNELHTFREDFEWWTDEGTLHGSWSGHCTKCGLGFDYKIEPVSFYTKDES